MSMESKAKVISVSETSITILVLDGDWIDNVYKMPAIPDVKVFQFIKVNIHSNGTKADWLPK